MGIEIDWSKVGGSSDEKGGEQLEPESEPEPKPSGEIEDDGAVIGLVITVAAVVVALLWSGKGGSDGDTIETL